MLDLNRRCEPPMMNEHDRTTIVSIYPHPIYCDNPTVVHGTHTVPGGTLEKPSLYIVKPTYWINGNDPERPPIPVTVHSIQMATSIVDDYVNAMQEVTADARPGIFVLPKEQTLVTVMKEYKAVLETVEAKQREWYKALIVKADVDWSRSNGNPLSVSKHARFAAEMLGMKDKPWMGDLSAFQKKSCPACLTMVMPLAAICFNCKAVLNEEAASKMKFAS